MPFAHSQNAGSDRHRPQKASPEVQYLRRLAENKTPVVVHLLGGDTFRGYIEYYDRRFIRLTRRGEPNLFIFKHEIKYLYEEEDEHGAEDRR
ncbi:MAG: RNA chaperone Hfq [Acidobacteria bacterium]|nr:RNA chaperone Hfq [Acidobacteriota bacterium]